MTTNDLIAWRPVDVHAQAGVVSDYLENAEKLSLRDLPHARVNPEDWHRQQKIFPKRIRLPTWRERLTRTLDTWSNKRYVVGQDGCFLFAWSSVDALLGTDFENYHRGRWGSGRDFWRYIRVAAGLDCFDFAGIRKPLSSIVAGDIIQIEEGISGRVHLHWAVAADKPNQMIMFTVGGLGQEPIPEHLARSGALRIWSPVARHCGRGRVGQAPRRAPGSTCDR